MLNLPTQEPAVRGGRVGSCPLDQRSRTAGVRPSLPCPSLQIPKGPMCTPGITWPKTGPQSFPESLPTREAGAALPAHP